MQHGNGGFAGSGVAILFLMISTGNAAADSANGSGLPSAGAPNAM